MTEVITPVAVERRLIDLGAELDKTTDYLIDAEHKYSNAKTAWEINSAKARMQIRQRALEKGVKITVSELEDESLLRCQDELMALNTTDATVKAARASVTRVRTQIEIARSVGTSVRTSLGSV